MSPPPAFRLLRLALLAQGVYYVVSGAWPLVSMATFEQITGPKTDDWLVHMVGVLAVMIGVTLLYGTRRPDGVVALLAVLTALGFAAIDLVYGLSGVIRPVYLADAAVELILAGTVLAGLRLAAADGEDGTP